MIVRSSIPPRGFPLWGVINGKCISQSRRPSAWLAVGVNPVTIMAEDVCSDTFSHFRLLQQCGHGFADEIAHCKSKASLQFAESLRQRIRLTYFQWQGDRQSRRARTFGSLGCFRVRVPEEHGRSRAQEPCRCPQAFLVKTLG